MGAVAASEFKKKKSHSSLNTACRHAVQTGDVPLKHQLKEQQQVCFAYSNYYRTQAVTRQLYAARGICGIYRSTLPRPHNTVITEHKPLLHLHS